MKFKQSLLVIGAGLLVSVIVGKYVFAQTESQTKISESQVGRFQIYSRSGARNEAYLLDTCTGQIWHETQWPVWGNPSVWLRGEKIDTDEQMVAFTVRMAELEKLHQKAK